MRAACQGVTRRVVRAGRTVEQVVEVGRVVDDLCEGLCDLRAVAHVLCDGGEAGGELGECEREKWAGRNY